MNVPSVKVKSDSLNSIFKTFKEITHLGNDTMTNLDSILKSRDITLPTKVCLVKAIVFPVTVFWFFWWLSIILKNMLSLHILLHQF